ncbi:MAG: sigma-70 family RNA polymerase sigma factor [Planctomycetota bacterium]
MDELAQEPAAFDALFRHFHPRLVRFLSKQLEGSLVDAEDVAQEAMVKAWRKRERFDARYQFSTWVYTIARRTAADHLRKNRRFENRDPQDFAAATTDSPSQSFDDSDSAEQIWKTAEQILSPRQYAAIWLRYGEEMSIKEVAKALSKTSVSTRVLLHRARTTLQSHLAQTACSDQQRENTNR